MTDNIKSLVVERLRHHAEGGLRIEGTMRMASDAADLIEQQAARIAELERDLADQRDKHACVLRLMKCDEDFIALQVASVAEKKD